MKKLICIGLFAVVLGGLTSCSNKLCPAYGTYPHHSR